MKKTVHGDVKFHSQMPFTNTDVCFETADALDVLICALQSLRDGELSQVTLADPASYLPEAPDPGYDCLPTEVTFHRPGHERDEIDLRALASARSHLCSLVDDD